MDDLLKRALPASCLGNNGLHVRYEPVQSEGKWYLRVTFEQGGQALGVIYWVYAGTKWDEAVALGTTGYI